jgi:hypothetical protein
MNERKAPIDGIYFFSSKWFFTDRLGQLRGKKDTQEEALELMEEDRDRDYLISMGCDLTKCQTCAILKTDQNSGS